MRCEIAFRERDLCRYFATEFITVPRVPRARYESPIASFFPPHRVKKYSPGGFISRYSARASRGNPYLYAGGVENSILSRVARRWWPPRDRVRLFRALYTLYSPLVRLRFSFGSAGRYFYDRNFGNRKAVIASS